MTIVVLLILAVMWALFLLPPLLRSRARGRPRHSVRDFRRWLQVLDRTRRGALRAVSTVGGPGSRSPARLPPPRLPRVRTVDLGPSPARARRLLRRRRRRVLAVLSAGVVATLVLGTAVGWLWIWALHLLFDGLVVVYVGLLVRLRSLAAEREMKVRFLRARVPARPEPLLQRWGT